MEYGGSVKINSSMFSSWSILFSCWTQAMTSSLSPKEQQLTWGSIPSSPNQHWGYTGHWLGRWHFWLMQLGLSGKWLSKQGPERLPLTGTSALSLLIHSKEPQSNTQHHAVTSVNTAQSRGTSNPTGQSGEMVDNLLMAGLRQQLGLTVRGPQSNFPRWNIATRMSKNWNNGGYYWYKTPKWLHSAIYYY